MKYEIKYLYTDEKQTEKLTDQFGNAILFSINEDSEIIAQVVIPNGVVGAEEFAKNKLVNISEAKVKEVEANTNTDFSADIAKSFEEEMKAEAEKSNKG